MPTEEESPLKQTIRRLEEALKQPSVDCDVYRVRGYDIRLLFQTIKDFGGRKDWTPTDQNLLKLPRPVRRHILDLQQRLSFLQREDIRRAAWARKALEELDRIFHPPR